jgi:hypothetical protein
MSFKKELAYMVIEIKNKKLIIRILAGLILILGLFIIFAFFIYSNITISPNKEYMAWYNRFSKVVTVEKIDTHTTWSFGDCENPSFLWSPNSKFLAKTFTEDNGNRFSDIMDIEHSYTMLVPTKSAIQEFNKSTQTIVKDKENTKVEITRWLDNKHVLVEFSWPSDKPGIIIAGWFNFEFSTYSIKQFNISED